MSNKGDTAEKTEDLGNKSDTINILLLGETGVGKSTIINSIPNYLIYETFENAENGELITLIPSKFNVQNKYGEYCLIEVGSENGNECLETGMSATQDVQSYIFCRPGSSQKIRLIDTPGIGDGRGINQDNINCENILSYIGQFDVLHAICFLFRPTNTRITVYFEYCIFQILSRLDKTASKNIMFIFTNTRGTDYEPGDSFHILAKAIDNIRARPPYADIPLKNKKNVFCLDNEAYRFLAATKQNVEFSDRVRRSNIESWEQSKEQINNLLKYIAGDHEHPPLEPHLVKSTRAINEARRLIVQLSQPLADITDLIRHNLNALQRHKEDLNLNCNTLEDLKKKLYIPVIGLEIEELSEPVTVCTNKDCSEIYTVGDISKWHYKQRCHDPCSLTDIPKEIVGDPGLIHCYAIDSSTGKCRECQCHFSIHMHVYYLTKTVEQKQVDKNVQQNINDKKKLKEKVEEIIRAISIKKDELEKEHVTIVTICAKFAHFLQQNAITPFSDSYKGYIEYLILREQSLGAVANKTVIDDLQKLLREYEAAKKSFDEALLKQKNVNNTAVSVTPEEIQKSVQTLYKLKHNGKKIKQLYECQQNARAREHTISDHIFNIPPQPKKKKQTNKISKGKSLTDQFKKLFTTERKVEQTQLQVSTRDACSYSGYEESLLQPGNERKMDEDNAGNASSTSVDYATEREVEQNQLEVSTRSENSSSEDEDYVHLPENKRKMDKDHPGNASSTREEDDLRYYEEGNFK